MFFIYSLPILKLKAIDWSPSGLILEYSKLNPKSFIFGFKWKTSSIFLKGDFSDKYNSHGNVFGSYPSLGIIISSFISFNMSSAFKTLLETDPQEVTKIMGNIDANKNPLLISNDFLFLIII